MAMVLLGFTFGLAAVAVHEAWWAGDTVWMVLFLLAAGVDVILYGYVVHLWVNYLFD